MNSAVSPARRTQRGMSVFGLVFWAVVVSFIGLIALRVLPTLNEYFTIQRAVKKVAAENAGSIPAIRAAFERQKDIEYAISSIGGSDLEIESKADGFTVRFAYDKEIELFPPVFLLIKYRGGTR
jgi:uncharacterized membrane protein YhiD involved in acid resistance